MLLVGYSHNKKYLYFLDPNYILPEHREEGLKIKENLLKISEDEFYQFTKDVDIYIELRCNKKTTKKLKNGLTKFL